MYNQKKRVSLFPGASEEMAGTVHWGRGDKLRDVNRGMSATSGRVRPLRINPRKNKEKKKVFSSRSAKGLQKNMTKRPMKVSSNLRSGGGKLQNV